MEEFSPGNKMLDRASAIHLLCKLPNQRRNSAPSCRFFQRIATINEQEPQPGRIPHSRPQFSDCFRMM
jgi:hypothetical protein